MQLVAQNTEPVRVIRKQLPKVIFRSENRLLIDFGINLAGVIELKIPRGITAGEKITFRHAEVLSNDGELFTDNAVRDAEGHLKNTGNTSEACQYYAILFGRIDINDKKYEKLKSCIFSRFAEIKEARAGFVPVNAFIGFYLRIMSLEKLGYYGILLEDIKNFFKHMVDKTNTLWEYMERKGSYDHSFAAYVACAINRALTALSAE